MERVLRDGAFAGETHLVTGAGQGIGRRVAEALAAHGALVGLVDLDAGRLGEVAQEIAAGGAPRPHPLPANVADEAQVQRAVASLLEASGQLNGVVNVAGITRDARIPKKSFDDFKSVLAVHLHGTFLFTREVAAQHWHPLFKANGNEPLRDGVNRFVVNFSSVSARNGNVGQIDYTAAKGAIEAVTRTTAREFASYGARVNAIAPGPVNTDRRARRHRRVRLRPRRPEDLGLRHRPGPAGERRHVLRVAGIPAGPGQVEPPPRPRVSIEVRGALALPRRGSDEGSEASGRRTTREALRAPG
jgi:3-oxoacyl-[acyl-carrier protein] reductase